MLRDYILFALGFAAAVTAWPVDGSRRQPLRFTKDGTFQLSVFSDLHYGEAEDVDWGPVQDINTTRVMSSVLSSEPAQLVVLNGDLITGENTYLSNSSAYLDVIVGPLVERGLLWASTYGNHDSDFNLSREAIYAREKAYPNSLTGNMVPGKQAGVTNYYLPVYPYHSEDGVPELILWFFDSRGGNYYQEMDVGYTVPQPNWVDISVVQWFTETKAKLAKTYKRTIPSIAFFHIPVNAMLAFQNTGVNNTTEPGINDDVPLAQQGVTTTSNGTGTAYTGQDIPFMEAILNTTGMMATFSGHDHGDDWCFKWNTKLPEMDLTGNGVDMCFDRHSGYGGYGTWTRGGRQILFDHKTLGKEIQTWVRLEDGSISGKVTLNSTYGIDEYPAVQDTFSS